VTASTAYRYEVRSPGYPTEICDTLQDAAEVKAGLNLRERHCAIFAITNTGEAIYVDPRAAS
jgi:hypothetical protein